jgi:predicted TIM-barrel enzyme
MAWRSMIGQAHALGLLTCPYIFNEDDAQAMTRPARCAGAAHGLTTSGSIGASTAHARESAGARRRCATRRADQPDVLVLFTVARSPRPKMRSIF